VAADGAECAASPGGRKYELGRVTGHTTESVGAVDEHFQGR